MQADIINEWIDRIKEATARNGQKHHSMSPSYTSQTRIDPIPVSSLPLQNERNVQFKGKLHPINNQIFHQNKKQQKRFTKPNGEYS